MKAVIICSALTDNWVEKFFGGTSPYLLPVLGKPLIAYYLDFCALSAQKKYS